MVKIGKTYKVNHSRKGEFIITVTTIDGGWVSGELIDGEIITLRTSLCQFTELEQTA